MHILYAKLHSLTKTKNHNSLTNQTYSFSPLFSYYLYLPSLYKTNLPFFVISQIISNLFYNFGKIFNFKLFSTFCF